MRLLEFSELDLIVFFFVENHQERGRRIGASVAGNGDGQETTAQERPDAPYLCVRFAEHVRNHVCSGKHGTV
jgi:hypothetical protein